MRGSLAKLHFYTVQRYEGPGQWGFFEGLFHYKHNADRAAANYGRQYPGSRFRSHEENMSDADVKEMGIKFFD